MSCRACITFGILRAVHPDPGAIDVEAVVTYPADGTASAEPELRTKLTFSGDKEAMLATDTDKYFMTGCVDRHPLDCNPTIVFYVDGAKVCTYEEGKEHVSSTGSCFAGVKVEIEESKKAAKDLPTEENIDDATDHLSSVEVSLSDLQQQQSADHCSSDVQKSAESVAPKDTPTEHSINVAEECDASVQEAVVVAPEKPEAVENTPKVLDTADSVPDDTSAIVEDSAKKEPATGEDAPKLAESKTPTTDIVAAAVTVAASIDNKEEPEATPETNENRPAEPASNGSTKDQSTQEEAVAGDATDVAAKITAAVSEDKNETKELPVEQAGESVESEATVPAKHIEEPAEVDTTYPVDNVKESVAAPESTVPIKGTAKESTAPVEHVDKPAVVQDEKKAEEPVVPAKDVEKPVVSEAAIFAEEIKEPAVLTDTAKDVEESVAATDAAVTEFTVPVELAEKPVASTDNAKHVEESTVATDRAVTAEEVVEEPAAATEAVGANATTPVEHVDEPATMIDEADSREAVVATDSAVPAKEIAKKPTVIEDSSKPTTESIVASESAPAEHVGVPETVVEDASIQVKDVAEPIASAEQEMKPTIADKAEPLVTNAADPIGVAEVPAATDTVDTFKDAKVPVNHKEEPAVATDAANPSGHADEPTAVPEAVEHVKEPVAAGKPISEGDVGMPIVQEYNEHANEPIATEKADQAAVITEEAKVATDAVDAATPVEEKSDESATIEDSTRSISNGTEEPDVSNVGETASSLVEDIVEPPVAAVDKKADEPVSIGDGAEPLVAAGTSEQVVDSVDSKEDPEEPAVGSETVDDFVTATDAVEHGKDIGEPDINKGCSERILEEPVVEAAAGVDTSNPVEPVVEAVAAVDTVEDLKESVSTEASNPVMQAPEPVVATQAVKSIKQVEEPAVMDTVSVVKGAEEPVVATDAVEEKVQEPAVPAEKSEGPSVIEEAANPVEVAEVSDIVAKDAENLGSVSETVDVIEEPDVAAETVKTVAEAEAPVGKDPEEPAVATEAVKVVEDVSEPVSKDPEEPNVVDKVEKPLAIVAVAIPVEEEAQVVAPVEHSEEEVLGSVDSVKETEEPLVVPENVDLIKGSDHPAVPIDEASDPVVPDKTNEEPSVSDTVNQVEDAEEPVVTTNAVEEKVQEPVAPAEKSEGPSVIEEAVNPVEVAEVSDVVAKDVENPASVSKTVDVIEEPDVAAETVKTVVEAEAPVGKDSKEEAVVTEATKAVDDVANSAVEDGKKSIAADTDSPVADAVGEADKPAAIVDAAITIEEAQAASAVEHSEKEVQGPVDPAKEAEEPVVVLETAEQVKESDDSAVPAEKASKSVVPDQTTEEPVTSLSDAVKQAKDAEEAAVLSGDVEKDENKPTTTTDPVSPMAEPAEPVVMPETGEHIKDVTETVDPVNVSKESIVAPEAVEHAKGIEEPAVSAEEEAVNPTVTDDAREPVLPEAVENVDEPTVSAKDAPSPAKNNEKTAIPVVDAEEKAADSVVALETAVPVEDAGELAVPDEHVEEKDKRPMTTADTVSPVKDSEPAIEEAKEVSDPVVPSEATTVPVDDARQLSLPVEHVEEKDPQQAVVVPEVAEAVKGSEETVDEEVKDVANPVVPTDPVNPVEESDEPVVVPEVAPVESAEVSAEQKDDVGPGATADTVQGSDIPDVDTVNEATPAEASSPNKTTPLDGKFVLVKPTDPVVDSKATEETEKTDQYPEISFNDSGASPPALVTMDDLHHTTPQKAAAVVEVSAINATSGSGKSEDTEPTDDKKTKRFSLSKQDGSSTEPSSPKGSGVFGLFSQYRAGRSLPETKRANTTLSMQNAAAAEQTEDDIILSGSTIPGAFPEEPSEAANSNSSGSKVPEGDTVSTPASESESGASNRRARRSSFLDVFKRFFR